jgi:3-dehydroquinate synthase
VSASVKQQLSIQLKNHSYSIEIQSGLVKSSSKLKDLTADRSVFIISNNKVADFYLQNIQAQLSNPAPVYLMPDGEEFKNLQQFEQINAELMKINFGRDAIIIALGGGVVGDLSGFVAACYQRGIEFIQIPTTLLAQIDASVGGKTAVNHSLGKNMIGAFHQPSLVIIDPDTLLTLEDREFNAGLGEAVKYGLMADASLFEWIEENAAALMQREMNALHTLIYRCCEIKAKIVTADEKEKGVRALLNLGHTFAHAVEAETAYKTYLHGEAVAIGLVAAIELAVVMGHCDEQLKLRLLSLLTRFNLPVSIPRQLKAEQLIKHMLKDKKNRNGVIHFVVNKNLGGADIIAVKDHALITKVLPYNNL